MKVFSLIASILALFNSLGECAPNTEEARPLPTSVSSGDTSETIDATGSNPDGASIFHIDSQEFEANFSRISQLYTGSRNEKRFLNSLASVIQCNHLMYNRVYEYLNALSQPDTEMRQIVKLTGSEATITYPNSEVFDGLVRQKESLKEKLRLLLKAMQPSHDMVEPLLRMMNSMNADTKIDPKIYGKMYKETGKVTDLTEQFENVFRNFPINSYRGKLRVILLSTDFFEFANHDMMEADRYLNKDLPKINEIWSKLEMAATNGLELNFIILFDATTNVYGYVMQLLNDVDAPSSSNRKGSAAKAIKKFMGLSLNK